jgi:hypothetical protein
MPLLETDIFVYQFYRAEKPQNDLSPCIHVVNSDSPYETHMIFLKKSLQSLPHPVQSTRIPLFCERHFDFLSCVFFPSFFRE